MKKYVVWYYDKSTQDFTSGGMQYNDLSTAAEFADTNSKTRNTTFIIEEIEHEEEEIL